MTPFLVHFRESCDILFCIDGGYSVGAAGSDDLFAGAVELRDARFREGGGPGSEGGGPGRDEGGPGNETEFPLSNGGGMGSLEGGPGVRGGALLGGPGTIESLAFFCCSNLWRAASSFCSFVTGYNRSSSLLIAALSSSEISLSLLPSLTAIAASQEARGGGPGMDGGPAIGGGGTVR